MGGGLKIFARKGRLRRNGGLPYYIEVNSYDSGVNYSSNNKDSA